ncbi:MAG: matrixin family metalloprotease [Planctomycetota bacterium]
MSKSMASGAAAAALILAVGNHAQAFVPAGSTANNSRWQSTASGSTGQAGDPITLTWSFVPDGTSVAEIGSGFEASSLIASLDAQFGSGRGGSDLTQRPWFTLFEQSFDRIAELAGVTYVYEPNDTTQTHGTGSGVLGLRGDVRIGGIGMDGSGGTLAYNYFPSGGADMAIDVNDIAGFFANSSNNYRRLRNTIMHEAIHGLGLDHSSSNNAAFLMEASINTSFDGPQHDDLRGLHWMYGDVLEKAPTGRNETQATATVLGELTPAVGLTIGAGGSGTVVGGSETDFVSVSNENDTDFFAFTVSEPASITATMTPRGANFNQTTQPFVTTETSDLSLALFGPSGASPIAASTGGAAGVTETINGLLITEPGTYYARIDSASSASGQVTQFYQLDLTAIATVTGDYNFDGSVDTDDYNLWRQQFGAVGAGFAADGNRDKQVDGADYAVWRNNLTFAAAAALTASSAPEPSAVLLVAGVTPALVARQATRRCRRA